MRKWLEQRRVKKASKIILELAKKGIEELDIEVDTGLHLLVLIKPIRSVTAVPKEPDYGFSEGKTPYPPGTVGHEMGKQYKKRMGLK